MSGFSVPLSSLFVQTMTSMALAPASAPADAAISVPPAIADQGIVATVPPTYLSGFRAEGSPELDLVFGDSQSFKQHVDRFFALRESMDELRSSFNSNVQETLTILSEDRRGCPADRIARKYYIARRDGDTYRALGAELEGESVRISRLDSMGETAALTPDYRWKVRQSQKHYRAALVDLKEMRVAFVEQLSREIQHRGCRPAQLLSLGQKQIADGSPQADPLDGGPVSDRDIESVIPASTVTFYVDNKGCDGPLDVFLDGTLLGQAPGKSRAAFQALAGRHSLCLIGDSSPAQCGDPGTVRSAFLHDGWSILLHCQ